MEESKSTSEMRGRMMRGLFGSGKFSNTCRLYRADEVVQILEGGRNLGLGVEEIIKVFKKSD